MLKSPFPLGVDRSQKTICADRWADVRCQMAKILSAQALILRCGGDYWQLWYKGMEVVRTDLRGTGGIMVTPSRETAGDLLAATNLDAASAEITWNIRWQEETWTVAGEPLGDALFRFPAPEGLTAKDGTRLRDSVWPERIFDYTLRLYGNTGELLEEVSG